MTDAEDIVRVDEIPEADALEQQRTADFDDDTGLDPALVDEGINDREANDADLIDQATIVADFDDE